MQTIYTENTDFSCKLQFVAENPVDVKTLQTHFKVFDLDDADSLVAYATALQSGKLSVNLDSSGKRKWFYVESALDHEFTIPYQDWLKRTTGYDGNCPDIDLKPYHPRPLGYTHIVEYCGLEHGHFVFGYYLQSEDWNGKTAFDRAQRSAEEHAKEDIGNRPNIPEYTYVTGKRLPVKAAACHDYIKLALWDWFLTNAASDKQRDIVSRSIVSRHCPGYLSGIIYYDDSAGKIDYDGKGRMVSTISTDEFAKLI